MLRKHFFLLENNNAAVCATLHHLKVYLPFFLFTESKVSIVALYPLENE